MRKIIIILLYAVISCGIVHAESMSLFDEAIQTVVKITYPYDSVYPTDHFPVIAQMTYEG